MWCHCEKCEVERRAASLDPFYRHNPDDLETLERIAKARRVYQETGSLPEAVKAVGSHYPRVRQWVEDLIIEDPRIKQARIIYQETGNIRKTAEALNANWHAVRKWQLGTI